MLNYHNPIVTQDNCILSIDNVVIDFTLTDFDDCKELMAFLRSWSNANVRNWTVCSIGKYREQFRIELVDGSSFWLGIGLNAARTNWSRCRIEFNPNKVAKHNAFQEILNYLIAKTACSQRVIKRFDLAIDIPVKRENFFLAKDGRIYREIARGKSRTQYLGQVSKHGYTRLYNKQYESNLPRPLTRLELTLDPAVPYEKIRFPSVTYLEDLQMVFDELKITDTERFILKSLIHGVGALDELGRRKRQKMETLLNHYVRRVEVSQTDYFAILAQLHSYIDEASQLAA